MCSNNCGRYVCAVHAMPRKGPGSAMVCLACAEALGLIEKPKPQAELASIVSIPAEPVVVMPRPQAEVPIVTRVEAPTPTPTIEPAAASIAKADETIVEQPAPQAEPVISAPPTVEAKVEETIVNQPAPAQPVKMEAEATWVSTPAAAAPKERPLENVVPVEAQSQAARRLVEPPPPPQSSETIVSQRGNTLQVPKVTATLGKPPQPIAARPRLAQRASDVTRGLSRQTILMAVGTVVLGIVGFLMILKALFP
jgi:hypothetical protein